MSYALGFNPLVVTAIQTAATVVARPSSQSAPPPTQIPANPYTPMYPTSDPDNTLLIAGLVGGIAVIGLLVVVSRRR